MNSAGRFRSLHFRLNNLTFQKKAEAFEAKQRRTFLMFKAILFHSLERVCHTSFLKFHFRKHESNDELRLKAIHSKIKITF